MRRSRLEQRGAMIVGLMCFWALVALCLYFCP
nr:MAG TPA: Protein of unknown function (DUF2615) [Caudoviricetes sp.]